MAKKYSQLAEAGLKEKLPCLETFPNQFSGYKITNIIPEFTSVCPKTGQPDFGTITIEYIPDKLVVELKSLKFYIQSYRHLGIFYENAVNRILKDFVAACRPIWAKITGEFAPRGGIRTVVEASYGQVPSLEKKLDGKG